MTTRFRIFGSAKVMTHFGPVEPMSRDDEVFWSGRERASREREERLAKRERGA